MNCSSTEMPGSLDFSTRLRFVMEPKPALLFSWEAVFLCGETL